MKRYNWSVVAREFVVSLFPSSHLIDSFGSGIKSVIGTSLGSFACRLEGHAIWWLTSSGWGKAHRKVISRIERNPEWYVRILQRIEHEAHELVHYTKEVSRMPLTRLTDRALFRIYREYTRRNIRMYNFGLICPLLDFQHFTYFTDKVIRILKKRTKLPAEITTVFSTLTTSRRPSFDKLQERALRRLYHDRYNDKQFCSLLIAHDVDEVALLLSEAYPGWFRSFQAHVKRFAWLTYVYEGPPADEIFFLAIMRDWVRRKINPQAAVRSEQEYQKKLMVTQQSYMRQLRLSANEKNLIKLARETTFIKPWRRAMQTQSYLYFESVLREIARRLHLSLRQVRYMLLAEVGEALETGQTDVHTLNERIRDCVYINTLGKKRILTGRKVKSFWHQLAVESAPRVKELRGTVAYPGRIRGRVCVVNTPEDIKKMNIGDVLISVATSPNIMTAIRRAKAIVTNEGGLTSHAAIVSREFRIPCVIGTKFVTEIFKDGDRIEVDATKGIVRKI